MGLGDSGKGKVMPVDQLELTARKMANGATEILEELSQEQWEASCARFRATALFQSSTPCWKSPMFHPYSNEMARMWEWSNLGSTPVQLAEEVMRSAGFVSFAGYPGVDFDTGRHDA
mgnify:FL=1